MTKENYRKLKRKLETKRGQKLFVLQKSNHGTKIYEVAETDFIFSMYYPGSVFPIKFHKKDKNSSTYASQANSYGANSVSYDPSSTEELLEALNPEQIDLKDFLLFNLDLFLGK